MVEVLASVDLHRLHRSAAGGTSARSTGSGLRPAMQAAPTVEVEGLRLVVTVASVNLHRFHRSPAGGTSARSTGSGLRPAMQAAPTVEVGGLRLVVTVASVNLHRWHRSAAGGIAPDQRVAACARPCKQRPRSRSRACARPCWPAPAVEVMGTLATPPGQQHPGAHQSGGPCCPAVRGAHAR